jgi:hypothetical protein
MAGRDVAIGLVIEHSGPGDWCWVAFPHEDMKKYPIQSARLKLLTKEKNKNNIPT